MTKREKNKKAKEMIQQKIAEDGFISKQDKRSIMAKESAVMDDLNKAALSHADAVGSAYARIDRNQYNCPHVFSYKGKDRDVDQLTSSKEDIEILEAIVENQAKLHKSKSETMEYLYNLLKYNKSQMCMKEVKELREASNG